MSTSTTNRGFPLSQYLCYADKILQDLSFDTKYVWDDEIHHAGRRGVFSSESIVFHKAEVEPTIIAWMAANFCHVLGQRSQTGRLRGPPPNMVHEERVWPNQPDPFRCPRSQSEFLG